MITVVRITTEEELDYCLSLAKKFTGREMPFPEIESYGDNEFLALLAESGVVYLVLRDLLWWVICSVEEAIIFKLEPDCEISDLETLLKLKST